MTTPKHISTDTYDCTHCGAVYWIKPGNEVPICENCFSVLVLRPEGAPSPVPEWITEDDENDRYYPAEPAADDWFGDFDYQEA
jgi:hypothetical protein